MLSDLLQNETVQHHLKNWKNRTSKNFVNSAEIISFANQFSTNEICPGGGIGRRAGFKIQFSQESAGSIPAPGTKKA
jgi:hypothetical protein